MSIERIEDLAGHTLIAVDIEQGGGDDKIIFTMPDGTQYALIHDQECCEGVWIEDVNGDPNDLVGAPLQLVEASTNEPSTGDFEYQKWTFYRFGTWKGYVDVRWCGESNGYYSVDVDFVPWNEE